MPCLEGNSEANGATSPIKENNGNAATGPKVLVWSAADAGALERMLSAYHAYFRAHIAGDQMKLDQLSHTLVTRRSTMSWRTFAFVDAETTEFSAVKAIWASSSTTDRIAFVFTGQGAQYAGMGRELLQYPVFESSLKQSEKILTSIGCEWSLFGKFRPCSQGCLGVLFRHHSGRSCADTRTMSRRAS